MQDSIKVETLNSHELINEATAASSNEPTCCPSQDEPATEPQYATYKVNIDGKSEDRIIAFTRYSMQIKAQEGIVKLIDKEKMLRVIFHLAEPEIFWQAGEVLHDKDGHIINPDTENVLVHVDTASTSGRILVENTLEDVEVHNFSSVEEYAQAIGNTMLLERGLNTKEKLGYAALASGDKATMAIYEFSMKNGVPTSIAEHYLDTHLKPTTVLAMTLGKKPDVTPVLGREPEEAQTLYEQMVRTFTKGSAQKRYAIRVVNTLLKDNKFSMEEMMLCLRTIPANEVSAAELMNCGIKEACIASVLTSWLIKIKRGEVRLAA